jgi:MarR family transcriptional regulator, lower aerobic nicotinate degradation pathway regulator
MNTAQAERDAERAALPEGLLRSTGYLLAKLGALARRRVSERLVAEDLGIPLSQYRLPCLSVLHCLAEFEPISQREICRRLGMDGSDVVALLDDLEGAGYVVRRRDPRDRRRHAVTLTPDGHRALRRLDEVAAQVEDAVLAPLSAEEREVLHRLLLRALAHHDARAFSCGE